MVAGAHDFNTWNQLFTTFARDYVWQPSAWDLKVSAAASVRCVAGKALVYVSTSNADANASVDLSVRRVRIEVVHWDRDGQVRRAVLHHPARDRSGGHRHGDATAVIQGDPVSTQVTAAYGAASCN